MDCYFYSVINSLCNYPDIIKNNIFFSKFEFNNLGIYAFRLFDDGIPKCIYVDDSFPKDSITITSG